MMSFACRRRPRLKSPSVTAETEALANQIGGYDVVHAGSDPEEFDDWTMDPEFAEGDEGQAEDAEVPTTGMAFDPSADLDSGDLPPHSRVPDPDAPAEDGSVDEDLPGEAPEDPLPPAEHEHDRAPRAVDSGSAAVAGEIAPVAGEAAPVVGEAAPGPPEDPPRDRAPSAASPPSPLPPPSPAPAVPEARADPALLVRLETLANDIMVGIRPGGDVDLLRASAEDFASDLRNASFPACVEAMLASPETYPAMVSFVELMGGPGFHSRFPGLRGRRQFAASIVLQAAAV